MKDFIDVTFFGSYAWSYIYYNSNSKSYGPPKYRAAYAQQATPLLKNLQEKTQLCDMTVLQKEIYSLQLDSWSL